MESNQNGIVTSKPNCKDCGVFKDEGNTYVYFQKKSKRYCFKSRCKVCDKEYNKLWIDKNRDKHNQYSRNYYRNKTNKQGKPLLHKFYQLWQRISNGVATARRG